MYQFRAGKTLSALGLVLGLGIAGGVQAAAPAPAGSPSTAIAIMQAGAAVQAQDCAAAIPPLTQLWNDPSVAAADPALAAQFRTQLIACTAQTQGMAAALALSTTNIARADASASDYDLHVFLQLVDKQNAAAAATLNAGLTKFSGNAGDFSDMSVFGTLLAIRDGDPAAMHSLLNHLEEVHWQAHSLSSRPLIGYLRMTALREAVAAGDTVHADLYRGDIAAATMVYVVSQGDGTLSSGAVAPQDIKPVIGKEIDDLKTWVAANPTDLLSLSILMSLERADDQDALALTQLNGILALIDQYGLDKFDSTGMYGELLTDKAEMLADIGRDADAKAAYAAGAAKLTGDDKTNLQLSWMNYLTDGGDEKAGIELAGGIALASGDSYMIQAATLTANLGCAYGYAGDEPAFAQAANALAAVPIMRIKPYLCAGDAEGAARDLIAAMADPDSRNQVILFMQDGLSPIAFGPRDQAYVAALEALKKRPDVLAAAAANHILVRTWPLRF